MTRLITDNKWLPFVIKMCRLKPEAFVVKRRILIPEPTKIFRRWVDEYGKCLEIEDGYQTIKVEPWNNSRAQLINTDLYACLPLDKIAKMSKLLYLRTETNRNSQQLTLAFLGIDNFMRTYRWNEIEKGWDWISPLELDLRSLVFIAAKSEVTNYYSKLPIPKLTKRTKQEVWLSSWPPHSEFVPTLNQFPVITQTLNTGKQ